MYLDYDNLVLNYISAITYACRTSDTFTLITKMKKPFQKHPPVTIHDVYLSQLIPFLISQDIGIKKWPGTITGDNHKLMNTYKVCRETEKILKTSGNPFIFSLDMPEDICFWRKGQPWLVTTSHEKIAYLENPTANDISFIENGFPDTHSNKFKSVRGKR